MYLEKWEPLLVMHVLWKFVWSCIPYSDLVNRPLSFISLSHSGSQSDSTAKFYNSSKADVGGNVLTLTLCVLRSDRAQSVWMPTDFIKFPVHSVHLLRKKLWHLAGRHHFFFFFWGWVGCEVGWGWGGGLFTLVIQVCTIHLCVCAHV